MDAIIHKCPGCNSVLPFNPATLRWECPYCGNSYSFSDLQNAAENSQFKQDNNQPTSEIVADVYRCSNCGAEMVADQNTAATFCVYCGSSNIIKNRLEGEFNPDFVIPFKKVKEDAIKAYQSCKRGRWFAPKEFGRADLIEKISGVYIPFWLYDGKTYIDAKYYCTNTSRYRSGDYIVTKKSIYSVIRSGNMAFSKVPCDGSVKFDDDLMDSIEPFDYSELKPFNMSYLSGFLAEKYDVDKEQDKKRAELRMTNTMYSFLRNTIHGYGSVSLDSSRKRTEFPKIYYALFPVWMLNTTYKGKMYQFAMNGQTGKFIGDIPIDKKRFWLIYLFMFLGLMGIGFLVKHFLM